MNSYGEMATEATSITGVIWPRACNDAVSGKDDPVGSE